MTTPQVTETKHLSAHQSVPVVVTCSGHVLQIGVPAAAPKR